MKLTLTLAAVIALAGPVAAQENDAADFFRKDKNYWSRGLKAFAVIAYNDDISHVHSVSKRKLIVRRMVAKQAEKKLGRRWVRSAVKIAYVESRFNPRAVGPKTRHGRARGASNAGISSRHGVHPTPPERGILRDCCRNRSHATLHK